MNKKAEYKSAIRSRKLIRTAFADLIKEKDLGKITVTDIVKRADINRGTFYAHYQDVQAVSDQIGNEIIEKMLEFLGEFNSKCFFQNPQPILLKVSKWLEDDFEFYKTLINANGAEQFLEELKTIFVNYMEFDSAVPESIKKTPAFLIRVNFFAGGILTIFQVWFRGDLEYSFDELSKEVSDIISCASEPFF